MLLLTGVSGFLGSSVLRAARDRGLLVRTVMRSSGLEMQKPIPSDGFTEFVPAIDSDTNWIKALHGVETIIHCAARVHVTKDLGDDPLNAYRTVNVDGTLNLARQAALVGVKRLIFISSIGVNGALTSTKPFSAADVASPHSAYAMSKHEAEVGLKKLASETGIQVVIIRPPLVYGPNAPGNFGALMRWISRGLPLPLGCANKNRRSLVALDNLVDLILLCTTHPNAGNQTFLVSDEEDLSTADLLQKMGNALGRPPCLLRVPVGLLNFSARLLGKSATAQSLLGSLQMDISHTCRSLGWKPPISVDEGLRRAAQGLSK